MRSYAKPIFARRHYEAIAQLLRENVESTKNGWPTPMDTAERFITMFMVDNLRFDQERFRKACGIMER